MSVRGWLRIGMTLAGVAAIGCAALAAPETPAKATIWSFLGGNPESQQYSTLSQINTKNVSKLGLLWSADLPVNDGLVGSPLIRDGVVYESAPLGIVMANSASTGKLLWEFVSDHDLSKASLTGMYGVNNNRGLAIDEKHVYATTGDCHVFALDRKTGNKVWMAKSCDPTGDYGIIMAPRVGGGKVFIGNNNHELGSERGFVDAFDAATGKHLWRFYTTPGDPAKPYENDAMAMAAKTWAPDHWKWTKGGSGAVWEGMTYDPTTNLLIFGTGNPAPANPTKRGNDPGDELFVNSIVAVDATTGKYAWHFQEVPGGQDGFDSDGAAHIVLANLPLPGGTRRVVMQAAKDGYFYVLDAKTGQFISANNYAPVENFNPIDHATGKLTTKESQKYWLHPDKQIIAQPGGDGAHSWQLMSYDPDTGLVYIPSFIAPALHSAKKDDVDFITVASKKYPPHGRLVAWDPIAQKERWGVDYPVPFNGGVLTTAGNLVLQGTPDGRFMAYAADSGQLLWAFNTKSVTLGAPSTAIVNGKQMIFVPAGDGGSTPCGKTCTKMSVTDKTLAPSRLLAFGIGGTGGLPDTEVKLLPQPILPRQPAELAEKGAKIYAANSCSLCHGSGPLHGGSHTPDLRAIRQERYKMMPDILQKGALRPLGMPQFSQFTDDDIKALRAFIINQGWDGYDRQKAPKKTGS